jgi:diguanylate cyclase (GGDEF)-like protein
VSLLNNIPLYPVIATGLIHIVIFFNYIRRVDTDRFQRNLYLSMLAAIFFAIITNFTGAVLQGRSGGNIHILLYVMYTLFFLFQQFSYYQAVVFIDYIANRNSSRTKKLFYIVLIFLAVNLIIITLNIFLKFYFYIDEANRYVNGDYFLIRFYLGYSAVLAAIIDIFISAKFLTKSQVYVVVVFAVLVGAGAALDMVVAGENFIWAFFTVALLSTYFNIIRSDTTQDSITGIGNRSSFTEFISQISRMSSKQSYWITQFDINGLKKINAEHGTQAGDTALSDMAAILKKCSRQSDFIARVGADEFIVAIKAKFDVKKLVSRILQTLETQNNSGERPYTLSISYAYTIYTTKIDQTLEEFLHHLNSLVFQHKTEQRKGTAGG